MKEHICNNCGKVFLGPRNTNFCSVPCRYKSRTTDVQERFWEKVDKSGGPDACWIWTACQNGVGYGYFGKGNGHLCLAHRFAYETCVGAIPEGMFLCHKCDVRHCVNPAHMFIGTQKDNLVDAASKGHMGSGPRDHPEKMARGERVASHKLTAEQVLDIRRRYIYRKVHLYLLGDEYGVAANTIKDIVDRVTWKHI